MPAAAKRNAPAVRRGLVVRSASLVAGLFVFALGIVLQLESELGLSPWDVLNQGLAKQTPLSFGAANVAVALVVLAVARSLGARIGPGTFANAILIGVFVDLLLHVEAVADLADSPLAARIALLAGGIASIGVGSAFYIGAAFGAGPRDSLMLVLARRTGWRIGVVRALIESSATVAGFALGGTVGVGTLVFALTIGAVVEGSFALLRRSRLATASSRPRTAHIGDAA